MECHPDRQHHARKKKKDKKEKKMWEAPIQHTSNFQQVSFFTPL